MIMMLCFTCGERKIWSNIKNSQNIETTIVYVKYYVQQECLSKGLDFTVIGDFLHSVFSKRNSRLFFTLIIKECKSSFCLPAASLSVISL